MPADLQAPRRMLLIARSVGTEQRIVYCCFDHASHFV
jgi:hypothetical protein